MKHLLLLCFICLGFTAMAQALQFENNLKTTFEKAKVQNKPVFVEYYNSDCPVCKKVGELFNNNDKLIRFYCKSFVNYRIDISNISKSDSLFLANTKLSFSSFPYFLFFDSNENLLHVSAINLDVDFLISIGTKALNPDERTDGLAYKYNKGDRSIKTLYAYSQLVQLYNNDSLAIILADDLYKAFPKNTLGNKKSYTITKNCVNSIENGFFKFWIKNMDELEGQETDKHKGEEKPVMAEIVRKSIYSKKSKNWDLEKITEVKKYILLTELSKNPDAFFWQHETELMVEQQKYKDALLIGEKMLNEDKTAITANLNTIRHFMTIFKTANELTTVKQWLDGMVSKVKEPTDKANVLYLNAQYLVKTNQKAQALEAISIAQKYFKENNLDTKELSKLTDM